MFISIVMVFFCLLFYSYIKQMLEKIEKFELILKEILEQLVLNKKEEDRVSLEQISVSLENDLEVGLDKNCENIDLDQSLEKEALNDANDSSYCNETENSDNIINTQNKIEHISFDLSDFVKRDNRNIQEQDNRNDYLKTVSDKIVQELKPQTVELTDYEKEQEEHAVISYKELLSLKERIELDSVDDDIRFVEDLKNFRNMI